MADQDGFILIAPWGRNLHSLFVDGLKKDHSPYLEPNLFDDFSSSAGSWTPSGGTWALNAGAYRQSDTALGWKESILSGSSGKDYAVRCRVRDLYNASGETAIGVNLRRQANGDCYHVDLYRDPTGAKYVRLYKVTGGVWQQLFSTQFPWAPLNPLDGWIDLKFSCYQDYLEVYVNDTIVNMQPGYDSSPYGYGRKVPGAALPSGSESLCSYGGPHEFDEVRVQNEYEYGERDVVDCILNTMEKYKIDPTRVFLAGHSQGGLGAYTAGLHNPDMFAALRPSDGFSDINYDYQWLKTYYPPNPGSPYADVNDGNLCDYMRTLSGSEPDAAHPERLSVWNGSSARYILENAVNTNLRIVHGTPDANVPNSRDPVGIAWWQPWWILWLQLPAPAPYNVGVSTYCNGKDIADTLASWASGTRYQSVYVTNPFLGHGFLEPYADTANYFMSKTLNRKPLEVAYKTFDNVNTGAWWLRLEIPQPGTDSAALHARNLKRLPLDTARMGLDNGAGKTMSFTLDDNPAPNVFTITDTTGSAALELLGAWPALSCYSVVLDGTTLQQGTDYSVSASSLVINKVTFTGGHTLTVTSPGTLPPNLAQNPGVETADSNGNPSGWSSALAGGASATVSWDDQEAHGGARSLRLKDAQLPASSSTALWTSSNISVSAGTTYRLSAFAKSRMFRGNYLGLGIAWYSSDGTLLSTSWSPTFTNGMLASTRDWSPVLATGQTPADASYARIVTGASGGSPSGPDGSAWFDDFYLSQ